MKAPKLCSKCQAARNRYDAEYARSRYHERLATGMCTRCGLNQPEPGVSLCEVCRLNTTQRQRASYQRRRPNGTTLKTCRVCGGQGHNARGCASRKESEG